MQQNIYIKNYKYWKGRNKICLYLLCFYIENIPDNLRTAVKNKPFRIQNN